MKSGKNGWALFLLVLAGVVLGGFIGEYLGAVPYLSWLRYGKNFGLETPLVLEMSIIKVQFALLLRFNVAGIIGIVLSFFIYRRL